MGIFSKRAREVFAAVGAGLAPRRVDNAEAQTWGEEVESAVQAARGGGWDFFGTLANRASLDGAEAGTTYLQTDVSPWRLHIKDSSASGDWNPNAQPVFDSVSGWDAEGTLANRATYDAEPAGYKYLQTDVNPWLLHTKDSATSGDWNANPQIPFAPPSRRLLAASRNYYVATTGSDSNDGLSSGTAFLTIQHAVDMALSLDMGIYDVTISIAAGTYNEGANLLLTGNGNARISLVGAGYATTKIVGTTYGILATGGIQVNVQDLDVQGASIAIWARFSARMNLVNDVMLSGGTARLLGTNDNAYIESVGANIRLNADSTYFLFAAEQSHILLTGGTTIITQAARTFSGAVAYAANLGLLTLSNGGVSWDETAGTITGTRYVGERNAVFNVGGAGATAIPGTGAGFLATGAQYA